MTISRLSHRPRGRTGAFLCVTAIVAACERTTPASTRSDAERTRAAIAPIVDVGAQGGLYELSEVVGVATLSDGRFIIGNGATEELRVFSATGTHLKTIGRRGGGPGEFYSLVWVGTGSADTLLAYDIRSSRLSWFAPNGTFVRSKTVDTGLWSGSVIGRFADGAFLVTSNRFPLPRDRPAGLSVDSIELSRVSSSGDRWTRLAKLPAWQQFWTAPGAAGVGFGLPVFRRLQVVVCDSSVVVGYPDAPRVSWIATDGRQIGELTLPFVPPAISAAEKEQIVSARVARASADFRARIEAALNAADVIPSTYPPFVALGGDATGTLWVGLPSPHPDAPSEWARVAPNGDVIDTIRLAPRSRFVATTTDRVFVVSRDEDDVQHVLVYQVPPIDKRGALPSGAAAATLRPTGCHQGFFSALAS